MNAGSSFACFACLAVELRCSGLIEGVFLERLPTGETFLETVPVVGVTALGLGHG